MILLTCAFRTQNPAVVHYFMTTYEERDLGTVTPTRVVSIETWTNVLPGSGRGSDDRRHVKVESMRRAVEVSYAAADQWARMIGAVG